MHLKISLLANSVGNYLSDNLSATCNDMNHMLQELTKGLEALATTVALSRGYQCLAILAAHVAMNIYFTSKLQNNKAQCLAHCNCCDPRLQAAFQRGLQNNIVYYNPQAESQKQKLKRA